MKLLKKAIYLLALIYIGLAIWYWIEAPEFLTTNLMIWLGILFLACAITVLVYNILEKSYERIKTETDKAADILDNWKKDL